MSCCAGSGFRSGIPVRTVGIGCAVAVLILVCVRHRSLLARSSRAALGNAAGWVIGFCLLYVLAYLFTMPPATDEYLPLAWSGNIDLLHYLLYARQSLDLEPSNLAGFSFFGYVYLQTPGVFYVLGGFSMLFGADLMSSMMPMQLAVTALVGVLVARVSHAVFRMSVASALVIGGIFISGPFFRYVASAYFLSTLMSMPILLYLLWTTVAYRPQRWLDVPVAIRFGSAYVLLLFIYPFLFFVALAAQTGAVALRFGADLQTGEVGWSSWRDAGRKTVPTVCAMLAPLGVLVLVLRQRLEWVLDMVLGLSEPGVAGWPLDMISPLAILGLPGTVGDIGQVWSPAGQAWAIGGFCTIGVMCGLLYFGLFRGRTTPGQRTFAGLAGASFVSYSAYFVVVDQSYQQWKLASYSTLPLSFVVLSTAVWLCRQSPTFARVTRTTLGRHSRMALLVTGGVGLIGGNLWMHALGDAALVRFPATLRNIAMVDALPFFREMSIEMDPDPANVPTMLALHFLPSKRVHVVGPTFFPNEPLALEHVSRLRPHLMQNYGCQGIGHDETVTVPGVGCLLLAPPSLALDTVYPFNSSFLFVAERRLGQREPDGRWNIDSTVHLNLMADPRRVGVGREVHVNLRLSPYLAPDTSGQRAMFSWGAGRRAEVRLYPDFPKSTNTLYLYILRAKLSVRPAQVDGIYVNIISHGSTPARTRACSDTTPRPDALYRALSRLDAVSDQAHVNVTHCQI